jgi:hypothetical protein
VDAVCSEYPSNQEIEKINFATSDSEKRLKNWVERESGLGMIQGLTVNSTYTMATEPDFGPADKSYSDSSM